MYKASKSSYIAPLEPSRTKAPLKVLGIETKESNSANFWSLEDRPSKEMKFEIGWEVKNILPFLGAMGRSISSRS